MVHLQPVWIDEYPFTATHVALPKTNLLAISNSIGYAMCGALDIALLRTQLASRGIVAVRATGVKTISELLDGTVESCTQEAEALGILCGMPIREALRLMGAAEQQQSTQNG
ncbi:hypothetical protein Alches_01390 [Alicyclobacillus hesperidum subsp. aegles]|uniref:YunC family protein n=1 Tax=Alicyclobacillus hesperidum TaxID=89784 RepID=UPI0007191A6F|nr:DUF1805 domain-containing protein [Alicyclobacillus hesperidum]GLG00100.1 hypothetical protein Alches_01390 [Alicyclobacillus hesperidum subsp. aegles]